MKTRHMLALLGCILVLALLITACSPSTSTTTTQSTTTQSSTSKTTSTTTQSSTSKTTSTTQVSTTSAIPVSILVCPQGSPPPGNVPQYGGTLKLIMSRSPSNLGNPWKSATGGDKMQNRYVYENLVGLDTKGDPVPQLATGWDANPDKKTITFTLRQGVKFHDGTAFNAAAAKWCLDTYRTSTLSDLKAVTSVDVIDDYHIRMNLSSWDPLLIQSMNTTGAGKMVSPTAAQTLGDKIQNNPVGTGPFKFVSYQANVSLKYQRFDGYWQKGLPYLDTVEISYVADPVVAVTSFIKGEGHFIELATAKDAKTLKEQGYTITRNFSAIRGIDGDSKNAGSPFADIKVRQAIAYAIDRNTIVNSVFEGIFVSTNQLAAPGMTAYDATIKGYPYNPAKAQELLAAAGYSTANPLTTKIVYTSDVQLTDLYTATQSYLKKVGINITLTPLDNAAFTKFYSSPWNNAFTQYDLSYNGIEMKYSNSLAQSLNADQYRFVSVWTPDDFNTLYKLMLVENDMAKREEYYKTLNKMAIDDYCLVVPCFLQQGQKGLSPKLHDMGMGNGTAGEFLPERAWLSK